MSRKSWICFVASLALVSACDSEREQIEAIDAAETSPPDTSPAPSDVGIVKAVIDGRNFEWAVPTPNTDNCTIYHGVVGIKFQNADGNSSIKIVTSGIEIIANDQFEYRAIRNPLAPEEFNEALTIDGNTVTYIGPLRRTPNGPATGFDADIVDAEITAICNKRH